MNLCARCMNVMDETATVCDRCGHDSKGLGSMQKEEAASTEPEHAAIGAIPPAGGPPVAAASPSPVSPANPLSPHELAILMLAVVGTGLVTFALLMFRGSASPEAASAAPTRAVPLSTPRVESKPRSTRSEPRWTSANSKRWVGDAVNSVAFELQADDRVSVWTRYVQPLLVVRCTAGDVEVFVYTATAARIEPQTDDHSVRYALDAEPETKQLWTDAAGHDGLFARDGRALAERLSRARTMRFGFTPHNADLVWVTFNVAGLSELMGPAARQCSPPQTHARRATPSRRPGSR
jgi:hypothetical protein